MTSFPKLDDLARGLILIAGLAAIIYLAIWQADGASRGLLIGGVGAAIGYFFPGKPGPTANVEHATVEVK